MRIALRPSGGRGDYELSGSFNQYHAADFLEKRQIFQISPGLVVDGLAVAHRLAGKPRIRPQGGRHAYVWISALLLMPSPRRELSRTPNAPPQLERSAYTIAGIDIDVVAVSVNTVTFAPTAVWARTRGGTARIAYADRLALVTSLWSLAEQSLRSPLDRLLNEHKASALSRDHQRIVRSAAALQSHFKTDTDILPLILSNYGVVGAAANLVSNSVVPVEDELTSEDDNTPPEESKREQIVRWRKQIDRGPGAREFSLQVREAYDYRCLFSGERFPKLPIFDSAGVDGAHILPWSTHQLNSVPNGICLCKQCHWAFDNGLLRLEFDTVASAYVLSIPGVVEEAARMFNFDIDPFRQLVGRIDNTRLPIERRQWPSPTHIQEYNSAC